MPTYTSSTRTASADMHANVTEPALLAGSASRQQSSHLCTVNGKSEYPRHAPLSPQAMRQRPISQVERFGPYEKRHVSVDVQADPAVAAISPESKARSPDSEDAQALVVPAAVPPFVNGEIPPDFFKRFGQAIGAERQAMTALPRASTTSDSGAQPLHDTRQNRFDRP